MPGFKYPIPHIPMLGKGSILLDQFDPTTGTPTGFQHLGNCTKFELDMKDDIAELYQSLNKNVTLIATAVKKRQPKISITGTDFSSDHIARRADVCGENDARDDGRDGERGGSHHRGASAERKERYFPRGEYERDPTTTSPAPVAHVERGRTLAAGTDYQLVDPVSGLIYIPLGSTISTYAVTVTYDTLVGSFDQVAGARRSRFSRVISCSIPDPVDGQKIGVDIWRVNLNPNGKIGLIADDYGNWTLDGNILDDTANHPDAPFYEYTFF